MFCTSSNVKRWEIAAREGSRFCGRAVLNKHRKTWVAKLPRNLAVTINLYPLTPRCCMQAHGSLWNTSKWIKQQQNSLTDIVEQQKCFVGWFFISKWPTHAQRGTRYKMVQHERQREFFLGIFTQIREVTRVRYVQMYIFEGQVVRVSVNDRCV